MLRDVPVPAVMTYVKSGSALCLRGVRENEFRRLANAALSLGSALLEPLGESGAGDGVYAAMESLNAFLQGHGAPSCADLTAIENGYIHASSIAPATMNLSNSELRAYSDVVTRIEEKRTVVKAGMAFVFAAALGVGFAPLFIKKR